MKTFFYIFLLIISITYGCSDSTPNFNNEDQLPEKPIESKQYFKLDLSHVNQMKISENEGVYECQTLGEDPWFYTKALVKSNPRDSCVLTFEYQTKQDIKDVELFLSPIKAGTSLLLGNIPSSNGNWAAFSCNLSSHINRYKWGQPNSFIRLDLGRTKGVNIKIKNLYMRSMTTEEQKEQEDKNTLEKRIIDLEKQLPDYLSSQFEGQVTSVTADLSNNTISVKGRVNENGDYAILEIPPYQDITIESDWNYIYDFKVSDGQIAFNGDRYVSRDDFKYDRMLSKFAILKKINGKYVLASHAKYVNEIQNGPIANHLPTGKPKTKKGLSCISNSLIKRFPTDLKDLQITSLKLDLLLTKLLNINNVSNSTPYVYGGYTYYVNNNYVKGLDETLMTLKNHNITTAATVLLEVDSEVGKKLKHPRFTPKGMYTMPNMTTPASVNLYAAALNFLAQRYSGTNDAYGRIHHWIMHNEVDAGENWTNMGSYENTPMNVYVDTHTKSMRMAYNIIRQYNPNAEIFISITHHWNIDTHNQKKYTPKSMLDLQNVYSRAEGDFKWALAYHCYSRDLNNTVVWKDTDISYSLDSKYVTFNNLEVLNKWIQNPQNMYKGMDKRSLWLTENGVNSKGDYTEENLRNQSASIAYAWKKVNGLQGIDAIQYHRLIDNNSLFDIYFGLRNVTGDKKPSWSVYQAAGTASENEFFKQFLSVIQIKDWSEIFNHLP